MHRSPRACWAQRAVRLLREPFADPLLVVIPPADRLAPPLMRQLVGDEELGKVRERRRIVAPRQL